MLSQSIRALWNRGGQQQKAAEKVNQIIGALEMEGDNALKRLPVTKNGETRIKNCVKYDLPGYCRLITIQENNICTFVFLGTHDECDKWLNNNKGLTLIIDDNNSIKSLNLSAEIKSIENIRKSEPKISDSKLLEKLKDSYLDAITDLISGSILRKIEKFDSFTDDDEIFEICMAISEETTKELVLDVLLYLRSDEVDQAKNRIKLFQDAFQKLSSANEEEINTIVSNDEFILLDDFNGKDIENLMKGASWYDWMLFMHPQQRNVVERDFIGPARLLGVSGSGKTCVVVNRAIKLAKQYPNEKILITTINQALSQLIKKLLGVALMAEKENKTIINQIDVMSFWELSEQLIRENAPEKHTYSSFSEKYSKDIDVIWSEFYFSEDYEHNGKDLYPVHQSLVNRKVLPLTYVKQEFDWIRSAFFLENREEYLTVERAGRSEPFSVDYRKLILKGLASWENKMETSEVVDYLGLIHTVDKVLDKILPKYRSILVDELQDFGTTELSILRKLAQFNTNDLFLCGDIAQQVYTKHQMISRTGIVIAPNNYLKIVKNYRNSREILEAASSVFFNNVNMEQYNNKEFELLNPEFANFSSPKPFIRSAKNLDSEFNFSLNYLKQNLNPGEKGCIAFCGLTFFQVKSIGDSYDLSVLDGKSSIDSSTIFISDLEQTKGFEFDRMLIINCSNHIFPNPRLPKKEWFREISKLYVSMTRAKKELIIAYSNELSKIFDYSIHFFNTNTKWNDNLDPSQFVETITFAKAFETAQSKVFLDFSGVEYLYSVNALGLSGPAQDKILSVVTGKRVISNGIYEQCKSIRELIEMLSNKRITPQVSRLFGNSTINELKEHFNIS